MNYYTLHARRFANEVRVIRGDQIGRIFALWALVYFGQFFKLQKNPKLSATFFLSIYALHMYLYFYFAKTGRATFWVIFSQTHLVTQRPVF
jgi:hypothetical protein